MLPLGTIDDEEAEELRKTLLYQHVEIFPEVLGHEAKEGEEGPSEAVKAGITIVGVPTGFHTSIALWTPSERKNKIKLKNLKFTLTNDCNVSIYNVSSHTFLTSILHIYWLNANKDFRVCVRFKKTCITQRPISPKSETGD